MSQIDHNADANYQVRNDEIKATLQRLAEQIDDKIPEGWGFTSASSTRSACSSQALRGENER